MSKIYDAINRGEGDSQCKMPGAGIQMLRIETTGISSSQNCSQVDCGMLTTTCQYTAVIPGIVLCLTADKWTAECQPPLANIPDPSLVHIFGGAPFKRETWQKSKLQLLPFYIKSSTPPLFVAS